MRNLKKFLALVMAMVMAFSLMLTVNAANPVKTFNDADQITEEFVEAADVLTGMKVFQGDGDGFYPGRTITRAETAALIYRIATGDTGDTRKDLYKDYGNFADVASTDWFAGYVGYCANAGYIKGHGGYFNPYGQVTGYEALAMILRAVGYDKNHEFEGATWQTNVSALATQLGILKTVKSTDYGDRLYEPSRRDVVASLLFEAAQIPMVNYTQIGGYNKFQNLIDNTLNLSLGETYFGLKHTTRIVVGNQETGEKATVLGAEKAGSKEITQIGTAAGKRTVNWTMYTYPGTQLSVTADGGTTWYNAVESTGPVYMSAGLGLKVDLKSGLDLFGHKVKVWYNSTDGKSAHQTYAYFDKATVTQTVYSEDNLLTNGVNGLLAAAKAAGFSKDNGAVWSDQYSRFDTEKILLHNKAGWDDSKGVSQVCMYTLVSNSADKGVDVVIRENIELAQIRKLDTTSVDKTLTLGDGSTGNLNTDDTTDKKGFTNFTTANRQGEIYLDNLTEGSVQDLGEIVYATEIRGTKVDPISHNSAELGTIALTNSVKSAKDCLFKLETPETVESTVHAGTPNTDGDDPADGNVKTIVLGDGTQLKRSGISRGETAIAKNGRVINGAINVFHYTAGTLNVNYGETYTVYLDKAGRFMGFKQGTDKSFLYGTFADYEFGGLGTGAIGYAVTGVNWDGEIVENHVLTTIVGPDRDIADTFGALNPSNPLAKAYNNDSAEYMKITRKYLADSATSSGVGNQILNGVYRGFIVNPAGTFWNADGTVNGNLAIDGRGYGTHIKGDWTINKTDASYGFKSVSDGTNTVMLTNNTKFIVVSGTGLDTLKVEKYTGLAEFLGSSSEVTFDWDLDGNGNALPSNDNDNRAYYITTADRYNNVSTANNNQVDTVILPAKNLVGKSLDTLYYAHDFNLTTPNVIDPTGVRLGTYDQYLLYNNGEAGYYFLTAAPSEFFNTLVLDSTINGTPVYTPVNVAPATASAYGVGSYDAGKGICREDVAYTYVSTSDIYTGTLDDAAGANTTPQNTYVGSSSADENSTSDGPKTYRVDNAKVVDLTHNKGVTHDEFTSIADINAAISRGWTNVRVSVVNTDVNVDLVYVISATAPTQS